MSDPQDQPRTGQVPQAEVRQHHLSVVLRRVHTTGAVSRSALTRATGVNRSTTAALVAALAEAGLVREETPRTHRSAGRPSPLVLPVAERAQVIALEVGVERIRAERVGLGGEVLAGRTLLPPVDGPTGFEQTLTRLTGLVEELGEPAAEGACCTGVGIAVPGLVRRTDGLVRFAPNLQWADRPLAAALAARLAPPWAGVPVVVGNDADLGALGEHARGAARGYEDFVYLSANVGVGGGLFCGGRPVPGRLGYAGEIGHMIVNPEGRRCRCGARGCWETEIGTDVISEAAGLPVAEDHSLTGVVEAAAAGDERAARALDDTARWLAVGLGNLAAVLSPQLVIFGGGLQDIYQATSDRIERYGATTGLARSRAPYTLRRSALAHRAPLVGAAELAFAPLLADPLGPGRPPPVR
ncbi:ROK family protein [Streptomyces sp. NBC_01198]|uniref:ROK family protein n=1 Tax=Streptomyces sp. NBC_01198 TaxID=2903769 RepID=UPI002E10FD35|nr:ROK family protein [Streptomyces sp. NBC_01198]